MAKITKAELQAAKTELDNFFAVINHYGIESDSANKAIYYNRDKLEYDITIGKNTFKGYNIPVVAVVNGEFQETANQFDNWFSSLFGDNADSAKKRSILMFYHLAMLTDKASGWQIAGIAYTLKALRMAKVEYPDTIVIIHKKKTITAKKDDFDSMIDGALQAAEGNRLRVETDKGLRRIMHLDATSTKRTPATVLPQEGGKFRF